MFNFLSLLLLYFITLSHSQVYKTYDKYKIYEITGEENSRVDLVNVLKKIDKSLYYDSHNKNATQILLAPEHDAVFKKIVNEKKLHEKVLVEDFSKIIRADTFKSLRSQGFSWTSYYDVDDIYSFLKNVSKSYNNWTELIIGGESYEGRPILGVRINTPIERTSDKPVIFIESGIHAREWITPATITYFINQLLTSDDPDISTIRDQFDWRIFPTVNPDGYHFSYTVDRMWRKTRSKSYNGCYGADPNRNWDYNWGEHSSSHNPCDAQIYAGTEPFSEIETRTLSRYISSIENLQAYIAFHSDAKCLLLPYSDSSEHVDNYDDLKQIGETSLKYAYKVNGAKYGGPATASEILYKASGGSMDWVRHALGTRLVYTYELRGYAFHWPAKLIYQQGDEVTQMMVGLVKEANNLGYF